MSSKDLGGDSFLYNIWSKLGQEVFKIPQDTIILEPSTSLMRAALDHIKTNKNLFEQLTLSDIKVLQFLQMLKSNLCQILIILNDK